MSPAAATDSTMLDYEKEYEKKAFKALTPKEKAVHIWTYYKIPILIGAFLLFFAGWWINHLFIHPPAKTGFSVTVLAGAVDETAAEQLKEEYEAALPQLLDEGEEITVTGYRDSLDENLDYEQQTATAVSITAKYSVGELDVIIGSQESLQKLLALDYYLPLDEIFTEDELKTLLETANQRAKANGAPAGFVVTTVTGEEETEFPGYHPYMLCLAGCSTEEALLYDTAIPYMAVFSTTQNRDAVKTYIEYLMEK